MRGSLLASRRRTVSLFSPAPTAPVATARTPAIGSRAMSSSSSLPRDVQAFLDGYPGQIDGSGTNNAQFYENSLRCRPDGLLIDEFHAKRQGDYGELERGHGFIQWLFPIREHGMNYAAQPLTVAEIERMVASPSETRNRVVRSYQLMLDFYGMQIADEATGRIERTPGFRKRYDNLTRSSHNYLRISRICKSLGELGHARYVAPWLLFILAEQSEHHELDNSSLRSSMDRLMPKYWIGCQRDEADRAFVNEAVRGVRDGSRSFGHATYAAVLDRRARTGKLALDDD